MIVYVETNFILELAYLQERCESCRGILDLASTGAIALAIPAVCAAEARATWYRRAAERREFQAALQRQIREISRSEPFRTLIDQREMSSLHSSQAVRNRAIGWNWQLTASPQAQR